MLFRPIRTWLARKWAPLEKPEDADAAYKRHLQTVFQSPSGEYILHCWLRDDYCQISVAAGLDAMAVAFNEGRRSFIHEIMQDLHQLDNTQPVEVETESDNGSF